jgi:hypothetical protein
LWLLPPPVSDTVNALDDRARAAYPIAKVIEGLYSREIEAFKVERARVAREDKEKDEDLLIWPGRNEAKLSKRPFGAMRGGSSAAPRVPR